MSEWVRTIVYGTYSIMTDCERLLVVRNACSFKQAHHRLSRVQRAATLVMSLPPNYAAQLWQGEHPDDCQSSHPIK